ncbi:sulfite exporter TauE/SafE family protein [Lachnospiraceae bacterium]|jgi:uncharacterized membrane protein YfcA|nr:sulfite exporter TauE/SafE family protein [uncultured Schaedlerella sp.]MCI9152509.1 sulfite exporter TauE/SafE family protein [Ruminococcus sp.]NBI57273.1 sulfite exporter TauE/SafE family protein [Lachnospiraceae bacterium]
MAEYLFVLIVFLANVVEGITGFAGTMLAMPAAMLLIGVDEAKIILNIVAIFVSSNIAVRNYRDMDKKQAVKISLLMFFGMAAGLYLYRMLPARILMSVYGGLLILAALRGLFKKKERSFPAGALICVVLLAGIIHGMFLSGGSLLVIYAVAVLKDKSVIRATLAPVWIVLNGSMLIQNIAEGAVTAEILRLTGWCVIPVITALYLGQILHKRMKQEFFVKLTYVLLIISGCTLQFPA